MLTLKKYSNGRLYDTANKRYVTKEHLSKLVKEEKKVKVVLAKTGKDVTHSVLSSLQTRKKAKTNGKNEPLPGKAAIQKRVEAHKKWLSKRIDRSMDAILEMMNFPNKRQVVRLNADVKKLSQKVEELQNRHVRAYEQMKLKHQKELEILAQQYDQRMQTENAPQAGPSA